MRTLLAALALLPLPVVAQQECPAGLDPTTPAEHFRFHPDGTVTHLATGLVWQRCPLGTSWNDQGTPDDYLDDTCDGTPTTHTWQAALNSAVGSDLRLPNIKELGSIVELACVTPALNTRVFPWNPDWPWNRENGRRGWRVWSATPSHAVNGVVYIRTMDVDGGASGADTSDQAFYVLLVR